MIPQQVLLKVKKPAQYLGNELNLPKKDFENSYIRFALCFPDLYSIGMSSLGFRIIYGLLNSIEDVVCERFFLPQADLAEVLCRDKIPLFSWESKKRLVDFDIVGFSLGYELSYTNVLKILELSDIPLFSKQRDNNYPLIMGGGFCTLNPEPLADFFDLFLIGEAEELLIELIDMYRNLKKKNSDHRPPKETALHHFKYLEGVYIPSFYNVVYDSSGRIKRFFNNTEGAPLVIKRRFLKEIENSFYPQDWLVSFVEIVHDRLVLEIMRGCPHRCRFCQARIFYHPCRFRSIERILDLARKIFSKTGYEELSLVGLSVGDHPQLKNLIERITGEFKGKEIRISFSSLRPKGTLGEILLSSELIKKGGLTFAPETASYQLCRMINKEFDIQEFVSIVEKVYPKGFRHLKLYFMIGLPQEQKEDLDNILNLAQTLYEHIKKIYRRHIKLNLSINTFIPKPHTAFQWFKMEDLEIIKDKQNYILSQASPHRYLRINFHNLYMSWLECLLSRGDRRLSEVIYRAYKKGACFDAWGSYFSFDIWQEAFREAGIEPDFYIGRFLDKEEILPWNFIAVGTTTL